MLLLKTNRLYITFECFEISWCSAAEFVVFKLKELGKISEEDIDMVMEGFKSLDVDQSGTLTKADLVNSESSNS